MLSPGRSDSLPAEGANWPDCTARASSIGGRETG